MVEQIRRMATPKRVLLALVIANEVRGLIVVGFVLMGWWKLH